MVNSSPPASAMSDGRQSNRLVHAHHHTGRLDDGISRFAFSSLSSSADSLVIEAVIICPPTSIRTWAVVAPFSPRGSCLCLMRSTKVRGVNIFLDDTIDGRGRETLIRMPGMQIRR